MSIRSIRLLSKFSTKQGFALSAREPRRAIEGQNKPSQARDNHTPLGKQKALGDGEAQSCLLALPGRALSITPSLQISSLARAI